MIWVKYKSNNPKHKAIWEDLKSYNGQVKTSYCNNKKCFRAANLRITMISEGWCDTEDWRNYAENSALHHRNKLHFYKYKIFLI